MLTDTEIVVLSAAMNRIVPPDDFPDAWETGAGDYLLQQFRQDLRGFVSLYQQGLASLDAEARREHGEAFAALTPAAQDALLANVEAGRVAGEWPVNPRRFFDLLVRHTMEGYYADPGNGGNRDGISWRMVGFEVRG